MAQSSSAPQKPIQARRGSMDEPPLSLSEELKCSICLDVFTDPVSTPCGHNFCKSCLNQCWNNSQTYNCPFCKEAFSKRPELKINTALRQVVQLFKEKSGLTKPEVLCDICDDIKLKALKMCLVCQSSYCQSHLEPHQRVPHLKKHKLIDPENLENYMCKTHEKPLELFCRDDQTCVCLLCGVKDHKNHNTVAVEEESGERKPHLMKMQTDVRQIIQERVKRLQDIRHLKEVENESSEREKAESMELFTDLLRCIERCQSELLEMMEQKQKAAEKQAEELIKELEQEITELKRRDTELEQLSHTEDHLHLLQIYPSLSRPPHTSSSTDISFRDTQMSVEPLRKAMIQLQETLNEKLSKTVQKIMQHADTRVSDTESVHKTMKQYEENVMDPDTSVISPLQKTMQQYAVAVTLDPDTAHPNLILLDHGKQVAYRDIKHELPDNLQRFDFCPCVLAKEGFSSGRFYFEVEVTGKTDWDLGVVRESINRKGMITAGPEFGHWIIVLRDENHYMACESIPVSLSLRVKPQVVGVFVDYEEGLVSFYDVESKSHIYSFTGQSFTEKLFPYFSPFNSKEGRNTAPLIIRHNK
ncbi:E3 ubiquitin-protein ligase TRIM39-like [Puntigrus tetrazona]|uniref:E3 ubiquitin-protein ligase TRIM39-like n=1 Tax=Puntigrus tetrazona TaxID=1606681 RepID=UPI001C89231F|nr:E3 ubiquitin-protein ligase TRIM39-like [Puntigrus tetrazona]XP_043115198.1 E3 ubiquitin-protein ligase TRIM39-like [Puntigrus tetrazona]XP_043115199.1 E3 ubiquitin-protein ligase TRIM39-like [Puntigrus tetrazona]